VTFWWRISADLSEGFVTFERRALVKDGDVDWKNSQRLFTNLHATSNGTIETDGAGLLQVSLRHSAEEARSSSSSSSFYSGLYSLIKPAANTFMQGF